MAQVKDVLRLDYQPYARGEVTVPGSKSIANRALLLAALASGETILEHLLDSDDTRRMQEALTQLGITIRQGPAQQVKVIGNSGAFQVNAVTELFLGNAGTAMRPLLAVLAASKGEFILTGEPRMYERPIGPLVDALQAAGASISYLQNPGYPPLRVQGLASGLQPRMQIDGSMSSQYVSALLMLMPLLQQECELEITGSLVSEPYITLTVAMMASFGVRVEVVSPRLYRVAAGQSYRSPGRYWVEGDASSASYFLAAGAIAGGPVTVHGVGSESLQGDKLFAEVLSAMGAKVSWQARSITVSAGAKGLQGQVFDLNHIPDAAMTIATTALFAHGSTEIRNVANWRLKETDRLHAMATELRKTGAQVEEGDDWLRITPPTELQHAKVATYDDHRMAMCFALLTFAPCGVSIIDPQCCRKTYPGFFTDLSAIVHSN